MNLEDKNYTKSEVEYLLTEQELKSENKIIALTREREKLLDKISALKKEIAEIKEKMAGKGVFNPKAKIREYIKASAENGFDLSEAYNVDDSELLRICEELGLTEKD